MTDIDTNAIRELLPGWPVPPRSRDLILRLCDALDAAQAERHELRDALDAARTKLDMPCGSCHPCLNWADETWRREGESPPTFSAWQKTLASLDLTRAKLEEIWAARDSARRDAEMSERLRLDARARLAEIRALLNGGHERGCDAEVTGDDLDCDCTLGEVRAIIDRED